MNKNTKKIWNIISWTLILIVLALAILIVGVRIAGLKPYSVLSGSMEPKYHVGSLVYVKNAKAENIKTGDPITFHLEGSNAVATHRVVEINKEKRQFVTKGDANNSTDANPVQFKNLIGKATFSIPLIGYLTNWISDYPGKIISICVGIVLVIFIILPDMLDKAKKSDEGKENIPVPEEQ